MQEVEEQNPIGQGSGPEGEQNSDEAAGAVAAVVHAPENCS